MEDIQRRLSDLERWQKIMSVLTTALTADCCLLLHRVRVLTRAVNSLQAIVNDSDIIVRILHAVG